MKKIQDRMLELENKLNPPPPRKVYVCFTDKEVAEARKAIAKLPSEAKRLRPRIVRIHVVDGRKKQK